MNIFLYPFLILVMLFSFGLTIYACIRLNRNNEVFKYRTRIIDKITKMDIAEIHKGGRYNHDRWNEFEKISYQDMMRHPFLPLDSYYKGQDFNIEL